MDSYALMGYYVLIAWIVVPSVILLLLYGVVRVAVSRGLRDHQKWMEKNRPGGRGGRGSLDSVYGPITPDLPPSSE